MSKISKVPTPLKAYHKYLVDFGGMLRDIVKAIPKEQISLLASIQNGPNGYGLKNKESGVWTPSNDIDICVVGSVPDPGPGDPVSPLVLDLDGDGVETGGGTFFDHGGDGFMELTHWVGADDGLLAWDRNGNGVIDDGSELFGSNTVLPSGREAADGFAALRDLDGNGDGVIDSSDADWASLRVLHWADSDGDGEKDAMELSTLSAVGVVSLGTRGAASNHVDIHGNEHRLEGSYTKADGTTADMSDVWFQVNQKATFYSMDNIPEHTESIAALPEVWGSGRVYNLRDAMALDDAGLLSAPFYGDARTDTRSLSALVTAFRDEADASAREDLAEKILLRWAGAEDAKARDYGVSSLSYTTPQNLAVVEAFRGEQMWEDSVYRRPAYSTAQKVDRVYESHYEYLYGLLMLQTHLADLGDAMSVTTEEESGDTGDEASDETMSYRLDFAPVAALLEEGDNARRGEFLRAIAGVYGNSDCVRKQMEMSASDWLYEYDYHVEYLQSGVYGGEYLRRHDFTGTDPETGEDGHDGVDVFETTDGRSDLLRGRGGNDIYHLGHGTGHDRIQEQQRTGNAGDANDVIRVAPGINPDRVTLSRTRDDLVVSLRDADGVVTDSLRIENHYVQESARIERIVFEDGTEWTLTDFEAVPLSDGQGSSGDDTYDGSLDGVDGTLQGGKGSDTYWFGFGSGHDTVDETAYGGGGDGGLDSVRIKEDVPFSSVTLARSGYDLVIVIADGSGATTDTLTIRNHYHFGHGGIEEIVFSDGTKWTEAEFDKVPFFSGQGSDGNDVFDGTLDSGSDVMQGGWGGDLYWFGKGSGHDTVDEAAYSYNKGAGDGGIDVVRLKKGISASELSLSRTKYDLVIRITDGTGIVTDTLTIKDYYVSDRARIERVELADGTPVWDISDFDAASWTPPSYSASGSEIVGTAGNDNLRGKRDLNDIFDGDAGGNDILYGYAGDDVYLLGTGTGHDIIREHYLNSNGDAGDVIRLKSGIAPESVRLRRSDDGTHLFVELLPDDGSVADSLKVEYYYTRDNAKVERVEFDDGTAWGADEFMAVEIVGTARSDNLRGKRDLNDIFDGNAGGNDILYGYAGDDVYLLGTGTGHDTIREHYLNSNGDDGDVIQLKSGIAPESVRLRRSDDGTHLFVQLLADDGSVADSLKVEYYYTRDNAKVERVEFDDGTAWDADEFMAMELVGAAGNDNLRGKRDLNDIFDGDAGGNDVLYGYAGDDVYLLGAGTGHDTIREHYLNSNGDAGDVIRLKSGIAPESVRLRRSDDGTHLFVQLLADDGSVADSLKVEDYYTRDNAKVERVEFEDGTVWGADEFMTAEIVGTARSETLYGKSDLNDIFDGDAGGNDHLQGYGGDDVYLLGTGTGHDTIREHYLNSNGDAGDIIQLKSGIAHESVKLRRSDDGTHLFVELLADDSSVADSLKVEYYYTKDNAKVERVEFDDGTAWDADEFMAVELVGTARNDDLRGKQDLNDIFDGDAGGNDNLYGYGGDDVYLLGTGTGHDTIYEHYLNSNGDAGDDGDVIRIKSGIAPESVRVRRSDDGTHLFVELLADDGSVADSLKVDDYYIKDNAKVERVEFEDGTVWDADEFVAAEIVGTAGNDNLRGKQNLNDIFDGDAGGNDNLYGYGGDDVYLLGTGTGHDTIYEHYLNSNGDDGDDSDVIRLKSGIAPESVRLRRSDDGTHLFVELLADDGSVADSLKVDDYYIKDNAKVERVEFDDGTVWDADEFMAVELVGTARSETLYGKSDLNDIFDGDAGGNDILQGYGGDDVYLLGTGTGHDTIREHYLNSNGDAGDIIRLKSGIAPESVKLRRSDNGTHLFVELLADDGSVTDSLKVEDYYTKDNAKVERVEFDDGTAWDADEFMAAAIVGTARNDNLRGKEDLNDIFDANAGGNDNLYGYGGNDVYLLGTGTGHDTIYEHYLNSNGGDGDVIKVKEGFGLEDVELVRDGAHLYVQLLADDGSVTDSLKVEYHYTKNNAKVEHVEVDGRTFDTSQTEDYIADLTAFRNDPSSSDYATFQALTDDYWV